MLDDNKLLLKQLETEYMLVTQELEQIENKKITIRNKINDLKKQIANSEGDIYYNMTREQIIGDIIAKSQIKDSDLYKKRGICTCSTGLSHDDSNKRHLNCYKHTSLHFENKGCYWCGYTDCSIYGC
jgi:hypothetical protein